MTGEWVVEHADDSSGDSQVSINKQGWIQKMGEGSRKDYVCKGNQGLILVMFQLM